MLFKRLLVFLILLLAAPACSDDCPSGGQAGSCDFANTTVDTSADVKKLTLKEGCDYVPISLCSANPGFTCTLGGGASHSHRYAVIADQAGWDKLAATWSDPTACAPSGLPTDWTDTFLVLTAVDATASTSSNVSYVPHRRADGTLHIEATFDMSYDSDCDCLEMASLGLVVKATDAPKVCLKVTRDCQ